MHDLGLLERAGNFADGNVRCDERDGEFSAGQTHGEAFYTATLGEKLRLTREPEAHFIHPRFVNRPCDNGVELAASGKCDRLFERSSGGARSFRCWLAKLTIWLAPDDDIFSRIGNAP